MNRLASILALAASLGVATSVRADQILPPGRITPDNDVLFGPLKLGKRNAGKTIITPDTLQILGPGSTGDVSGMRVPIPGRRASPTLADIVGRTVDVADYREPADGGDWGPAFNRAIADITAVGGTIELRVRGIIIIATQVQVPNTGRNLKLRCTQAGSFIQNASALKTYMFKVGGAIATGAGEMDVEDCRFLGSSREDGYGFDLNNANGMTFTRVQFHIMNVGINAKESFAVTLDSPVAKSVTRVFYSETKAHNFVARRAKIYDSGDVFTFKEVTDNISIVESTFEGNASTLSLAGATSLRFTGNYQEYNSDAPIKSTAPIYGADISNNWIALGKGAAATWSMAKFVGGQFKGNTVHDQNITFGTGTIDLEVGDNRLTGTSSLPPSPYQSPSFNTGWSAQSSFVAPGFRKGRDGRVHLRGNAVGSGVALGTDPATGARVFTLPPGYRPEATISFDGAGTSGTSRIWIYPSGEVVALSAGGAGTAGNPYQIGLNGISFEPSN